MVEKGRVTGPFLFLHNRYNLYALLINTLYEAPYIL